MNESKKSLTLMNEEHMVSFLKEAYDKAYSLINDKNPGNKKGTVSAAFSSEDDKEQLNFVFELAKELVPEAIFEICSFHRSRANELKRYIDPNLLALFGAKSEQFPACGMINLYDFRDKPEQREKLMQARETILCGTEDGFYDDSGVTWEHICSRVLPIATRDIWDSLFELYNNEGAFVPKKDKEAFNEKYKEYLARIIPSEKSKFEEKTLEGKSLQKSFSEIYEETIRALQAEKYDAINQLLEKRGYTVNSEKVAIAFTVLLQPNLVEDSKETVTLANTILFKAKESYITRLFNNIDFSHKVQLLNTIDFPNKTLPQDWINAINKEFMDSIGTEYAGWWIGYLDSKNLLLKEYGKNVSFWESFKLPHVQNLIELFGKCLTPDRFRAFAICICNELKTNGKNNSRVLLLWQRAVLKNLIEYSDNGELTDFRNVAYEMFSSDDDMRFAFEELYLMAVQRNKQTDEQPVFKKEIADRSEEMVEKLSTAMKGLEELEQNISARRFSDPGISGVMTEMLKQIIKIVNDLSGFGEHEWKKKISPVVDYTDFLAASVLEYDSERHLCQFETIEERTPVKALSTGLAIDEKIKYKARVAKAD